MPNRIQKYFFMLKKFYKDITRDRQIYQLSEDLHSSELGEYYFIITEEQMLSGHSQQYHFDENGIPIIPTYIDVEDQRMVYYPISIGQYGLAIWNTYLRTQSEADKKRFLNIAEWFYDNKTEDSILGYYWLTDVEKPAYRIERPWKSAFSQARAINIMLRAFQLTGDEMYQVASSKALQLFQFSVNDGGITTFLKEGPFYEEYPADAPVLVLNGHIFALCGIYDFIRTHPHSVEAEDLFESGLNSLEKLLPKYDMGFWSKYSLCEATFHPEVDPSTIGYHYLHIIQLDLLNKLTGRDIFRQYADKWSAYSKFGNYLKMYLVKYKALKKMKRL
jgi:hypothetical protein